MKTFTVRANTKVNLTLAVTGRREDGYHTLETVMHSVGLCDELTVERTESGIILFTNDKNIPTDERNTAYKAAKEFFWTAGITGGVKITLNKLAPYEAGLGSASADAAAVLAALNRLYDEPLTEDALFSAALKVGADVPFCLKGGAALCEGIGEVITPQQPLENGAFLIVKPRGGVSTAEAYRAVDNCERKAFPDSVAMCDALRSGDVLAVAKLLKNDFTACCPVEDVHVIIAGMIKSGALGAEMSGSGSAVFGIFPDEKSAQKAASALERPDRRVWVALPEREGISFIGE